MASPTIRIVLSSPLPDIFLLVLSSRNSVNKLWRHSIGLLEAVDFAKFAGSSKHYTAELPPLLLSTGVSHVFKYLGNVAHYITVVDSL